MVYVLVALFGVVWAITEWWRWSLDTPYVPYHMTVIAVGLVLLATYKVSKIRKKLKPLRMARDGERAVGEFLERLRKQGCSVFHDIVGDNFNIDHVIVASQGIFAVETKTYSLVPGRENHIEYDGQSILINGQSSKSDILKQAAAERRYLQELLESSTGKRLPVKTVVVFPGWFVKSTVNTQDAVIWVLNPKALPQFLHHEPKVLKQKDVQLAAYHLSRHIRTS